MKKFFSSASTFVRALPVVILFELLFRLIMVAIGAPALTLALKLTMKAAGISYLSDEHVVLFLIHPVTIVSLIILLFLIGLFSFVELSALAGCFSCYHEHKRMSVMGMIRTGFGSFKKAFRGTGILRFLAFMLFMPLAQFTMSSGVFTAPLMPILRNIFRSVSLNSKMAAAVYILLNLLFIMLIVSKSYSLHYLVLTDRKFGDCVKQSKKKINGKKSKTAVSLILWSFSMIAAAAALTFIISFVILLFIKGFSRPQHAVSAALKVLRYAGQIFSAISAFISAPAIMCWLTSKFFADAEKEETITLPDRDHIPMKRLPRAIILTSFIAAALALNFTYIKSLYKGNINLNVGLLSDTQITAHRGASKAAPENTLPAFEAAIESGADYIELDVQLTSDGELVVFHDEKLDRTTDGQGILSKYTYEQLQQLSAGSWFGDGVEFADTKIPLLSEVLDLTGDDIMLNIEIKDRGDAIATAEKTVELIEEYDIVSSCYVTSFSYKALKKVKKLNPKIKTGLIANVATTASFSQLKYIDALSLNHLFVNQTVVNSAHQNGKRVFVWTVDSSSDMQHVIALGVDNIITNRPEKAAEAVYSRSVGQTVLTAVKTIFGT